MICKKDVIVWFKELESYKRIDTMCTLLSMCLPFELRFLGTCLEELGRRDSQELRGIELRVNNPQDLAIDMGACQKGEPTDMKIRRKMALYLALIRACNRTSTTSTEIFRTLDVWGERDFQSMNDMDTLQELLLVYTMAANHPVFSFEQHRRCIEIFENIKKNKLVADPEPMPTTSTQMSLPHAQMETAMSTSPVPSTVTSAQLQHDLRQSMQPPSHQEMMHPHALHAMHITGSHPQLLSCQPPLHVLSPLGLQHPITVDALHYMNLPNTIPADSNAILAHPNAMPPRSYPPPPGPPSMEHPPSSSSPMLSQQSSPSSSRTTSPSRGNNLNVMQQQQQGLQQPLRSVQQRLGGSSLKTTPPPVIPSNQKHVDDVVMNSDGSGNQLQALIRLNGYTRGTHPRLKPTSSFSQPQQQQSPVNQQYQTIANANYTTGLSYAMQNLALSDIGPGLMHMPMDSSGIIGMNSSKSTGSDSGSSIGSSGDISPPETPANPSGLRDQQPPTKQHQHHPQQIMYKQMTMGRLNNGRGEITLAPGGNAGTTSLSSNNSNLSDVSGSSTGNSMTVVSNPSMNTIGGTTVLINTSSSSGSGGMGNVLMQSQQQQQTSTQQPQYNATYSYHTTQHLGTTRPAPQLMAPPPATFRFPLQPNGEPIYQSPYHPTSIAFLAPSGTNAGAPPPPVLLTATTAGGVVTAANTTATTQLQQLQNQPGAMIAVGPYNTPINLGGTNTTAIAAKPVSCYNCGSQAHSGRECPEASMDDVTRSAVYKLDYSVSATTTPVTNVATTSIASGSSSGSTENIIAGKPQDMHSSVSSTGSASSSVAAVANIK